MSPAARILDRKALVEHVRQARARGETVALANGVFDLLHVGHLRYLERAAREAELLVVAVNSDRSAERCKGPGRPLVTHDERAELVAGFAVVDIVTVFDEDDVEALLTELRPDVHCKGTDYTAETVPERDTALRLGIRIAIVGDPKSHSTRTLIERLRD